MAIGVFWEDIKAGAAAALSQTAAGAWQSIVDGATGLWESVVAAFSDRQQAAVDAFNGIVDSIVSVWNELIDKLLPNQMNLGAILWRHKVHNRRLRLIMVEQRVRSIHAGYLLIVRLSSGNHIWTTASDREDCRGLRKSDLHVIEKGLHAVSSEESAQFLTPKSVDPGRKISKA
ncbi:hypothetical protein DPM33_05025 [Mesorhizobium hawassense]|uniref:Uncharacterized protein n=1 Tax=Mesorhizobium hawassense TaxID=1209954 RepID=A0A330HXU6_9HYPH|nr:hypothetical protein [Mesorhizobium hawassense]RAZ91844.1 hypothetical protein DPM33_05025 [Mesorhizobium hawassense]